MILLFLLLILIIATVKSGGDEKNDYHYILYAMSKTSFSKKFKKIYLDAYYEQKNVLEELKKAGVKYNSIPWAPETRVIKYDAGESSEVHKHLSHWPHVNQWTVTDDDAYEIKRFFYFGKIDHKFFNITIDAVDVLGTMYNRIFENNCNNFHGIGNFYDFLKLNDMRPIFIKIPDNTVLCKKIARLIAQRKSKQVICCHKKHRNFFRKESVQEIKLKKLYSPITKKFKKTNMICIFYENA